MSDVAGVGNQLLTLERRDKPEAIRPLQNADLAVSCMLCGPSTAAIFIVRSARARDGPEFALLRPVVPTGCESYVSIII